ncbi:hypothetical protein GCM10010981_04760 [Dyella nitratireducens]|uniref:Uncharacterized protein n=1 Tax=Dyella nitratireducens TaxID=1849580 RepID=A0ABQ1FLQ9_9GAMM|nr:hypothetical protein GCM10010981_04760 [Dyella nitratireducens]GLQ44462.1 hypothetical protein GCM10007902_43120 [Dyella nitratireducens]
MPELGSDRDTGKPDDCGEDKRRDDMTRTGLERRPGSLRPAPAALTSDERDGYPMVRHHGMQHADDKHGADEQRR